MLTKKQIKEHYMTPKIQKTIMRVSTDGNSFRAAHWVDIKIVNGKEIELQDWYKHKNGEKYKLRLACQANYTDTVSKGRVLYWTLNFFEDQIFEINYQNVNSEKSRVISRQYTVGYTLGIDIDKERGKDIHDPEVKKAIEDQAQFYSDFFRAHLPSSVYCLYSGGGIYILLHHKCFELYFKRYRGEDYDWNSKMQKLTDAFNYLIKDREADFFELHPEHVGKVKSDALNNSQRVFKTIFSIHKKLDYAVIPLNPENIVIDFAAATIPLSKETIDSGNKWYTEFDDGVQFIRSFLAPYMKDDVPGVTRVTGKKYFIQNSGYICSDMPIPDMGRWPPCMRNLYALPSCGEGATRALAVFVSFLGQIGIEEQQARTMFDELADRWDARKSNIFEAYFGKMNVPTCQRLISDDNRGFPQGVSIKLLNVCKKDLRCLNSRSPYYYADRKAKLRMV
ncbi:MAG: hypothetical protein WB014_06090 [Methanosarcina sp.]